MRMVSIMWHSHLNMLVKAGHHLSDLLELKAYSTKKLEEEPERLAAVLKESATADILFIYRSNENFWDTIEEDIRFPGRGCIIRRRPICSPRWLSISTGTRPGLPAAGPRPLKPRWEFSSAATTGSMTTSRWRTR